MSNKWVKVLTDLAMIAVIFFIIWVLFMRCTPDTMVVPEVHNYYHHNTDSIIINDTVIDRQTTVIKEVDSATMAQFGIQLKNQQSAWLVQNERLMKELSALKQHKSDTVHIRDTIPVSYPVEKKITAKERIKYLGTDLLVIFAFGGIILLIFRFK